MRQRRLLAFLCALILIGSFAGCNFFKKEKDPEPDIIEEIDPNFPVTVEDQVIEQQPERIVSLSASLVEKIYDLGLEKALVGVPEYTVYPKPAQNLILCGTSLLPDREAIDRSIADLIITEAPLPEDLVEELEEEGITVIVLTAPTSVEELWQSYENLALIFLGAEDGKSHGEAFTAQGKEWLQTAHDAVAGEDPVSAIYIRQLDFNLATGDTLVGELLRTVGFKNIADCHTDWVYPKEEAESEDGRKAFEEVDIFFFDEADFTIKELEGNEFYKKLPATLKDRYLLMDCTTFERSGQSMFRELAKMMEFAWPDASIPKPHFGQEAEVVTDDDDDVEDVSHDEDSQQDDLGEEETDE